MKRIRPYVLPARRPTDARPSTSGLNFAPTTEPIGLSDIVIVSGDSVRVCRIETANGPLLDGPVPLSLCLDGASSEAHGLVDGLRVTQVGSVLMLRVE